MKVTCKLVAKRILRFLGIMLCIVCAIVIILLLLNRLLRVEHPHPVDPNRINMEHVRFAVEGYRSILGRFPDSLEEIAKPIGKNGRVLLEKECLLDVWGEPFGYEYEGDEYVIWSSGPDKKLGTADDIVKGSRDSYVASWKAKRFPPVDNQGTNAVQEATLEAIGEKEGTR